MGRTHADTRDVTKVVHQIPLVCCQVETQHVVVDFVGKLVKPSKGIYLVIAAVGHGCVDQTGRTLADGAGNLGPVSFR